MSIAKEIEKITGHPLHPAPERPHDRAGAVMPMSDKQAARVVTDEQGDIIGLNLGNLLLNDEQWAAIARKIKPEKLEALNLRRNQITRLEGAEDMTALRHLDLAHNRLESLPLPAETLSKLEYLQLRDNPVPPAEILEQGKEAVSNYLMQFAVLSKGAEEAALPLNEVRLVLCGNGGVGKTNLVEWLTTGATQGERNPTHGILYTAWKKAGEHAEQPPVDTVHVWDFGGQEYYHATHRLFFRENALYLLLWEENPEVYHRDESNPFENKHPLTFWLSNIHHLSNGNARALVVQNKMDVSETGEILLNQQSLAEAYPVIQGFMAVSVLNGMRTGWLRALVTEQLEAMLLANRRDWLKPYHEFRIEWEKTEKPWYQEVKTLTAAFIQYCEAQSYLKKFELVAKKTDTTPERIFRDGFHNYLVALDRAGVLQYYDHDPELKAYVFLKPDVMLNRIYQDILSEKARDNKGIIHQSDIDNAIENRKEAGILLRLMIHFKLLFKTEKEEKTCYVASQYLPPRLDKAFHLFLKFDRPRIQYRFDPFVYYGFKLELFAEYGDLAFEKSYFWREGIVIRKEIEKKDLRVMVEFDDEKKSLCLHQQEEASPNALTREVMAFIETKIPAPGHGEEMPESPGGKEKTGMPGRYRGRMTEGGRYLRAKESDDWVPFSLIQEAIRRKQSSFIVQDKVCYVHDFREFLSEEERRQMPMKKVFLSYSKTDEPMRQELHKHLMPLIRQGLIGTWHDRKLDPGEEWDKRIREELRQADLILFLISADFINTDYIMDVEVKIALERNSREEATVVPVVLRPCLWQGVQNFGKLNGLPAKGVAVGTWANADEAYLQITKSIEQWCLTGKWE